MGNLPWDALSERLGKFLQLNYIATLLCGIVVSLELTILAMEGSADQRRALLLETGRKLVQSKWNVLAAIAVGILVVLIAYSVGYAAIALCASVFNLANILYTTLRNLLAGPGSHAAARAIAILRKGSWRRTAPETEFSPEPESRRHYAWYQPLISYLWGGSGRSLRDSLWAALEAKFGKTAISDVLRKNSLEVKYGQIEEVPNISDYCHLWLRRYASDVIDTQESRFQLLLAAVLPTILAPGIVLEVIAGGILLPVRVQNLLVVLILAYIAVSAVRVVNSRPYFWFYFFILAQLLDQNRPAAASEKTPESPKGSGIEERPTPTQIF